VTHELGGAPLMAAATASNFKAEVAADGLGLSAI
jgi:hypothetical protein